MRRTCLTYLSKFRSYNAKKILDYNHYWKFQETLVKVWKKNDSLSIAIIQKRKLYRLTNKGQKCFVFSCLYKDYLCKSKLINAKHLCLFVYFANRQGVNLLLPTSVFFYKFTLFYITIGVLLLLSFICKWVKNVLKDSVTYIDSVEKRIKKKNN